MLELAERVAARKDLAELREQSLGQFAKCAAELSGQDKILELLRQEHDVVDPEIFWDLCKHLGLDTERKKYFVADMKQTSGEILEARALEYGAERLEDTLAAGAVILYDAYAADQPLAPAFVMCKDIWSSVLPCMFPIQEGLFDLLDYSIQIECCDLVLDHVMESAIAHYKKILE